MLGSGAIAESVCDFLEEREDIPTVVDPVFRASAGAVLLDANGIEILRQRLLPQVDLATPNWGEAEQLLDQNLSSTDLPSTPLRLYEKYGCDFLVKAGHLDPSGNEVIDYACLDGEVVPFPHPYLEVGDVHGTGCTLSAAITACLAKGETMESSIRLGIDYLAGALRDPLRWSEPRATEALNHFFDDVESP